MAPVTRDVITDLWPLYQSGDLSTDSRTLVEAFLAGDPDLATRLRDADDTLAALRPPSLPPEHDLRTLERIKRQLWGPRWLLQLALVFSGLAFGRIVSDTSWDVSPRNFIVTAVIAGIFWIWFFAVLYWRRRSVIIRF